MIGDRDRVYLQHILEACGRVIVYTKEADRARFPGHSMLQDAVIRLLEIVGEASKQVSEQARAQMPSVRWADMADMRDRLIHHYFGVDLEVV